MKHSEALNKIQQAYWKLERCGEHTHEWDRYVQMVTQAERDHRRFKPEHIRCGLTLSHAVRLFVVKQVFERFVPAHESEKIFTPQATDFFRVRADIFAACAIAELCKEQILKAFSESEMREWLDVIDYAALNKDRRLAA